MKKFDAQYPLLKEMYEDEYFPKLCVDKIKALIQKVIVYLETGETDKQKIQEKLDEMTIGINNLQDDFEENDSEIETAARESIGKSVEYLLRWFHIDIDIETAIEERDW